VKPKLLIAPSNGGAAIQFWKEERTISRYAELLFNFIVENNFVT